MLRKTALLATFSVVVATIGQLLLKAGMQKIGYVGTSQIARPGSLAIQIAREPRVVGGLVLFGISALAWLIVLSRAPLSFAYPFAGLTYALVALFGKFALHEHVPAVRWFGISLIIGGIILVGRTAPSAGSNSAALANDQLTGK